jgi:hypothetical protein
MSTNYEFYSVICEKCGKLIVLSEDKEVYQTVVPICKSCYKEGFLKRLYKKLFIQNIDFKGNTIYPPGAY